MAAQILEQFAGSAIEVDWMSGRDATHIFPEWQVVPTNGVVYGRDIALARACCVKDVTMMVISTALAMFARAAIPLLFIRRVNEVRRARCAWALWPEAEPEGSWIWEPIETTGRPTHPGQGAVGKDPHRQEAVFWPVSLF